MITQIHDVNKKKVGELELKDEIFAAPLKRDLLFDFVQMQLANKRLGTASTKTRGEVKCSNKKPYRQKGTGRARHGSYASPIFVGGGVTFGPKPRSYSYEIPRKARRLALKSAVSDKFNTGRAIVVDKLEMKKPCTKDMIKVFDKLEVKNVLVVVEKKDECIEKSMRNIPNVKLITHEYLNVFDILKHEHLIFTVPAVKAVQEVLKS